MAEISITSTGQTELVHALDQWADETHAPRQLFVNLVSDVVAPRIAQRFAAGGPGWRPLSPAYAAWKQIAFPGKGLLVRSGAMQRALTDASRFGGAQSAIGHNSIELAPKGIAYFAYHAKGTKRMPARPPIDLDELRRPVGDYIEHWLTRRARDFGLEARG